MSDIAVKNTLAVVLAGGSGTRLHSLTQWHAKPAVPFGGKFRTIDFSLSNCINSEIRKISILTQYKSHSLNKHIQRGWSILRPELGEFIDLIPAQQRLQCLWYLGTADAVYQNMDIFEAIEPQYILVLAGDHVYKMNYVSMIHDHINKGADVTVGCIETSLEAAREFGVMSIDNNSRVTHFTEKPRHPTPIPGSPATALASMGIYVFNAGFLYRQLRSDAANDSSRHDFGHDIIPKLVEHSHVNAFPFRDPRTGKPAYWRDVGTIDAYYEANIDLCNVTPALNLYDTHWPIWTYQEQLPPAKFVFNDEQRRGVAVDSLVSSGCIVSGGTVISSLLSNNVRINSYATVEHSVVLNGAVIGRNCRVRNAIIDSGCKVPPNTVIGYNLQEDAHRFEVSPKGVVLVSANMLEKSVAHVA